jgi:hypothetical protein
MYSQEDKEFEETDENGDVIYVQDSSGNSIPKMGLYKRDVTEKVYSYQFNIYNTHNDLVYTSGENIHNNSTDSNIAFSQDEYLLNADISIDEIYYI